MNPEKYLQREFSEKWNNAEKIFGRESTKLKLENRYYKSEEGFHQSIVISSLLGGSSDRVDATDSTPDIPEFSRKENRRQVRRDD